MLKFSFKLPGFLTGATSTTYDDVLKQAAPNAMLKSAWGRVGAAMGKVLEHKEKEHEVKQS